MDRDGLKDHSITVFSNKKVIKAQGLVEITYKIVCGDIENQFNEGFCLLNGFDNFNKNYLKIFETDSQHLLKTEYHFKPKKEGDAFKAEEIFSEIIDKKPNHVLSYLMNAMARLYNDNENIYCNCKTALALVDLAINKNPNYAYSYYIRGIIKVNLTNVYHINGYYDPNLKETATSAIHDFSKANQIVKDYTLAILRGANLMYNESKYETFFRLKGGYFYSLRDYVGAIEEYSKVIAICPENSYFYCVRAHLKYKLECFSGAIEDYNLAIKNSLDLNNTANYYKDHPISDDYWEPKEIDYNILSIIYTNRGTCKYHLKDYQGALEDYKTALKEDPNSLRAHREIFELYSENAERFENENKIFLAIDEYSKIIDHWSNYRITYQRYTTYPNWIQGEYFYDEGIRCFRDQLYREAIDWFSMEISNSPNFSKAYLGRGNAKFQLGDYDGAIDDYTLATSKNSSCFKISLLKIAFIKELKGIAKDGFDEVVQYYFKGDIDYAYIKRAELKFKTFDKSLLEDLDQAFFSHDQRVYLIFNDDSKKNNFEKRYAKRAEYKFLFGDCKGSLDDYTKAIEINPLLNNIFNLRAVVKEKTGDSRGAIEDRTLQKRFNNFQTHYKNGKSRCKKGDFLNALESFNKAIELESIYLSIFFERGFVKYKLLDLEGAILDFSSELEINTDNHKAFFYRAKVYYDLAYYDLALKDINNAICIYDMSFEYYYHRVLINETLGELKRAIDDCEFIIDRLRIHRHETLFKKAGLMKKMGDDQGSEEIISILKQLKFNANGSDI
jgi:tetratricopeptide (TPR) repeat protein